MKTGNEIDRDADVRAMRDFLALRRRDVAELEGGEHARIEADVLFVAAGAPRYAPVRVAERWLDARAVQLAALRRLELASMARIDGILNAIAEAKAAGRPPRRRLRALRTAERRAFAAFDSIEREGLDVGARPACGVTL